ncbi:hypothetical protein RhiirA1_469794 [Rhizophagus irregularis]|uniref:F-box domain-containing protein n=4 Tax=Rhizophagus irregularis TaxID=588596 RepID=A0A2N0R7C4_9GLOM|nr:hypothetical protein GLOIN_2v1790848 [Rhizophagus irregularis DAOM 181602=DAOM 197198]PKC59205.1 hypothetical protein RhiirA1_469794 [Rhizophagus irregularis]POG58091.1 hypothetical protein GLOIN_2v1790848 [Rhizophagus irregularis DAOM 181602=DAOM 197198]GBC16641.1 hypothetical protein GLOIN_2v1790848 [Rhizophagus irregularis DAOM 181602=DAOM 197198]|eukprot:XP_025164957.1 hypothetical protein GLOIN_2v1790848 [Rhizophagus irregularis DAOM 181602=DAOM 197198]
MSCSKILSGDLPELTYEIIKYFRDDYSTLHSCILVNRSWCRLAIPLLWENPFSICAENYNFVEIYIHNLNDDLKIKLNECKIIDNNSLHLNTLFNYPSFLKYLNIYNFVHSVNEWFKANTKHEDQLCSVFDFISMSLFGIFIENEVNLHTLEIEVQSSYDTYIDNIVEFILKNPNFILNIRNLKLYILLNYDNEHSSDRILQIVNLHQNLKKIILNNDYLSLLRSLLLSKDYNCSNTLNTIVFYEIDFNFLNYEIFEQLNVLESIHIIYCSLSNNFFHQIINLSKQFKLKSLFIREIPQIDSIELLLQTSGHYLRNFGYNFGFYRHINISLRNQLLELITKYCKNIKYLYLSHGDDMNIYPLFNFIENMKQSLDYLTIDISSFTYHPLKRYYSEASQIILQNLGQVLPPKLEYLCLDLFYVESNDFEVFLKNSQDTFINKLLIRKINSQDILPYIKEYYIMKNKRVKYLSIYDLSSVGSKRDIDLFSLKDEVKEFGLYNIKVQSYNSSVIYDHMRVID